MSRDELNAEIETTDGELAANNAPLLGRPFEAYRRLAKHAERYRRARLLDFDEAAAAKFQELRGAGIRIGPHDLKIAAITLLFESP